MVLMLFKKTEVRRGLVQVGRPPVAGYMTCIILTRYYQLRQEGGSVARRRDESEVSLIRMD